MLSCSTARHLFLPHSDVGVDDALAVLLALASPEVSVAAITPTFGNTDCAHVSTNILKLFRILEDEKSSFKGPGTWDERWPGLKEGAAKIRVAGKGADRPVEGEAHTAAYFVRFFPPSLSRATSF